MNDLDPIIDAWYMPYDNGQPFTIVGKDEDANFIEIQYFNGDIEEISYDDWNGLDVEPCTAPESWSGALEMAEGEEEIETGIDEWSYEQEIESNFSPLT